MTPAMAEVFLNKLWVSMVEFYPLEFRLEQCGFPLFVWTHEIHFCCLDIQIRPGLHLNPNNFHPCLIVALRTHILQYRKLLTGLSRMKSLLVPSYPCHLRHLWTSSFWTLMITEISQCSCCKMRYEYFHSQIFVIDFLLLLQNTHLPLQHSLI